MVLGTLAITGQLGRSSMGTIKSQVGGSVIRRLVTVITVLTLAACSPSAPTRPPTTAPRPTASAVPVGVAISEPAGTEWYAWAPDGQHLLVYSDRFALVDTSGRTVASTDGSIPATWIDSQHFAAWSPRSATSIDGSVAIYNLDGSAVPVPGSYSGQALVGDGAGSLALLLPASAGKDRFVVWQDGVLGDPLPGRPLGWSRDGSMLIVATSQPAPTGVVGSPQSVSIAVLRRPFLAADEQSVKSVHVDPTYTPIFNAAGTEVAFQCAAIGQLGGCDQLVLDLRTGRVQDVASQPPGLPLSWLPDGDLLLAAVGSTGSGDLREWNGSVVAATALPRASWGLLASTGAIALVTEAADGTRATQVFDSSGKPVFQSPGSAASWSTDGSSLAIGSDSGDQLTILKVSTGS